MNPEKNLYATLDVTPDANLAQIKSAYRSISKKYHPDKCPGDEQAARIFKEATEAFEILSDPDKRAQYDANGTIPGKDQKREHALTIISNTLMQFIHEAIHHSELRDPCSVDYVSQVRKKIKGEVSHFEREITRLEKNRDLLIKVSKRFNSEGDLLTSMAMAPLDHLKKGLEVAKQAIDANKLALKLLEGAKFDATEGGMTMQITSGHYHFGTWSGQ